MPGAEIHEAKNSASIGIIRVIISNFAFGQKIYIALFIVVVIFHKINKVKHL